MQEERAASHFTDEHGKGARPDLRLLEKCAALIAGRQAGIDWRVILDAFADAVVAADDTHRIVYINESAEHLLGWPMQELVGQPLTTIIPPRLHASHNAGFARYLSTRRPRLIGRPLRLPTLRRDGVEIEVELAIAGLHLDDEKVLFVGSLHDLSDRIELERQLDTTRYLRATTRAVARLTTQRELEPLLETVVETLVGDLQAELAGFWLYEQASHALHLCARAGASTAPAVLDAANIDLRADASLLAEVALSRQPRIIHDPATDGRFDPQWVADEGMAAVALFPLVVAGELQGVLLGCFRQPLPEEAVDTLTTFSTVVAESTRRNRAEAALHASERRFRALIERSLDAIALIDATRTIQYASPATTAILGYEPEEFVGQSVFELVHPDEISHLTCLFGGLLDQPGGSTAAQYRLRHKDGSWRWLDGTGTNLLAEPSVGAIVANYRDVTERRRAEIALQESEARLQAIMDNSPAVIHLKDLHGRYLMINRRYETLFHTTPPQIVGKTSYDLFPQRTAERLLANDQAVFQAGAPLLFEEVVPHDDGPHTYVSVKFPLYDAAGTPYAVCGIATDITDRKHLEEELRRRAEELAAADRQKDQFLAMLAHELRNPLAPILNAVHGLRLRAGAAGDDPGLQRVRDVVERQARHMARLVDDLLDVSRITHGKIELRKEPVELSAVVRHAVQTSRPLIEARAHDLSIHLPPEPVRLEADPDRLSQVIANLLNNAAKYTEPGGRIWLTTELDDDHMLLCVRDTGIGIAPPVLPHVFDLFRQGDSGLARSLGGLGVGLTVVKSLVELHGGTVEAASAGLGHGSEFRLRLPLLRTIDSVRQDEPLLAGPDGRSLRVLVVDDNVDAAVMLAELLALDGHEVQVAHDGTTALVVAQALTPEAVLLDIGLPGMDGYEVARRLREEQSLQDTLLVALTGYGQEEDRLRSQAVGFHHHLVKPVDLEQLQALLAAVGAER